MRSPLILAALLATAGCASNANKYVERTYYAPDAEGWQALETETVIKHRAAVPPFGGNANTNNTFDVQVNEAGDYVLRMGTAGQLEGGDIAEFIKALTGLTAELSSLVGTLQGGGVIRAGLEPLTEP